LHYWYSLKHALPLIRTVIEVYALFAAYWFITFPCLSLTQCSRNALSLICGCIVYDDQHVSRCQVNYLT